MIKELETFIFCRYFEMKKEHEQDVQDNIEAYVRKRLINPICSADLK